jgi:hypothetical protein
MTALPAPPPTPVQRSTTEQLRLARRAVRAAHTNVYQTGRVHPEAEGLAKLLLEDLGRLTRAIVAVREREAGRT